MIMLLKWLLLALTRVHNVFHSVTEAVYNEQRTTKLLVEVSRHGARSSSKIYPFTVDPAENFQQKSWLTILGAE